MKVPFPMVSQKRVKDFLLIPIELNDLFDICKNEIYISNDDISITQIYTKILFDCLMQYHNLTLGNVNIISDARKYLVKNIDPISVNKQYKEITNPYHVFSGTLLKMLTDYKQINFLDVKFEKYIIMDVMFNLLSNRLINTSTTPYYSNTVRKQLLNSKINIIT